MTDIILYYISQFYPLIIGIITFVLLKSLNLFNHKTRISLESSIDNRDEQEVRFNINTTQNICDLSTNYKKQHSVYPYVYNGMGIFGNYITKSDEPRKTVFAKLIKDKLIVNGISTKNLSVNQAEQSWANKFGITDLNSSMWLTKLPEQLNLFFPEKETFLKCMLKPNISSGILQSCLANYNVNIVM